MAIIGDSRVRKLIKWLRRKVSKLGNVKYKRGGRIKDILTLLDKAVDSKTTAVYILVGINDITLLDRATRRIYLRIGRHRDTAKHIAAKLLLTVEEARLKYPHLDAIIVCPIIGASLHAYNECSKHSFRIQQSLLNAIIMDLNRRIKLVNENYYPRLHTPYVASLVHHLCSRTGRLSHAYNNLYDGLHPADWLQAKIASRLNKCIEKNRAAGFHY